LIVTVIVSVKINDGIVLAADSAGTMNSGHVYTHANKITHLCDGQLLNMDRSSVTPWRASICDWRYSGSPSQNLLTTTCTIRASVAMPPSRRGEHPSRHLAGYGGILQADAYAGFGDLYLEARKPVALTQALCWAHGRRAFFKLALFADRHRETERRRSARLARRRVGAHCRSSGVPPE
jgi:hypothetical protein